MTKIKIVTDSTSDLPKDLAKKYDIAVIPLNIFFGDEKFKDGVNILPGEFYGMCESGIYDWPTTSQPSANEFVDLYNSIFDEGYDVIISIHITPNMSGTLNSVQLARNQLSDKNIVIIDGNTATVPLGALALQAAKMVKDGKSLEEIENKLRNELVPNIRAIGLLDTLEYLHRGGRIGRAKKILGTILNKKPLLQIKNGIVESLTSVKGHDEGIQKLVKIAPKVFSNLIIDAFWIGYAEKREFADELATALKEVPGCPNELIFAEIGPTIGAHLGTGTLLIAWIGGWDESWLKE